MSDFVASISGDIVQVDYFANKKYPYGRTRYHDDDDDTDENLYDFEHDVYYDHGTYEEHNHEEEEELDPEEELRQEQEFLKQFVSFLDMNNENWENEIEYNYEKEDAMYEAMCKYDDGPRDDYNDDLCG